MLDDVSVLTTGSAASRRPAPGRRVQTLPSGRPASTRSDRSITSATSECSAGISTATPAKPGTLMCRPPAGRQRIAVGGVERVAQDAAVVGNKPVRRVHSVSRGTGIAAERASTAPRGILISGRRRRRFINTSPARAAATTPLLRGRPRQKRRGRGSLLSAWSPDSQTRPAGRRSLVSQPGTLSSAVAARRPGSGAKLRERHGCVRLGAANATSSGRRATSFICTSGASNCPSRNRVHGQPADNSAGHC